VRSNRIVTIVLEVADLEASARLYREAFGVTLKPIEDHAGGDRWSRGRHAAFSWTDGAFLHFALYEAKDGPTRNAQIAIEVDDIDAAYEQARNAGAELVHEPRSQPWGKSARFRDPDANVVELTQRGTG
jgi:predicted enzyme related to lactoylglutathione lyase